MMDRIRTSLDIIYNSLALLQDYPKLLVFPVLNIFGVVVIALFFAFPLFFETSIFNAGDEWAQFQEMLQVRGEETRAAREAGVRGPVDHESVTIGNVTFGGSGFMYTQIIPLAILYLLSMYVTVFINVALYEEIMRAFNGDKVFLMRGIRFAMTKWRAVLVWSLLAGFIGLLIRKLEEKVGLIGRWVLGLLGFSWSVASVFAIPVIIREKQQSNPVAYLKTSAGLIRKTWGEGLVGIVSITGAVVLAMFGLIAVMLFIVVAVAKSTESVVVVVTLLTMLIVALLVMSYLSGMVRHIYMCGLYIYATEGVVPAVYDAEQMEHAWRVKKKR